LKLSTYPFRCGTFSTIRNADTSQILFLRFEDSSNHISQKDAATNALFQISLTSYCLALSFPTFVFPKNPFFFNGLAGF
jgi:hypothetical protein